MTVPDVALLRSDAAAFADAVGVPLERWQAAPLELSARTTVVVAPRQSGKSRTLGVAGLWRAFREPAHRVLIVSASEDAARRLLAEVRAVAVGSPLTAPSVVDELAGLLVLSNGSELRSVPASERQVRGWSVDTLLVDEAALVPDDLLLGAALPTTAARPDARVVLVSSALVAQGAFYDALARGEAGSEHVRAFRWRLADCPWIGPSAVAQAREALSPQRFAAEYLGEFQSGADALFSRAALDRATADYAPVSLGALRGPARLLGGVDWGVSVDRSAFVALGRVGTTDGSAPLAVLCAHRWAAGHPLPAVVGDLARCPGHFAAVGAEVNGVGHGCVAMLREGFARRDAELGGGPSLGRLVLVDPHTQPGGARYRPRPGERLAARERAVFGSPGAPGAPGARHWRTELRPVTTNAELKAATYAALRVALESGGLVLPAAAEELRRELALLRVELMPSGHEHIAAASGHDDLADALMLASLPYRGQDGTWRTVLADLATRGAVAVSVGPGPTVLTGDGRELARVPPYASALDGARVTLPPEGDRARRPPLPDLLALRAAVAAPDRSPTREDTR